MNCCRQMRLSEKEVESGGDRCRSFSTSRLFEGLQCTLSSLLLGGTWVGEVDCFGIAYDYFPDSSAWPSWISIHACLISGGGDTSLIWGHYVIQKPREVMQTLPSRVAVRALLGFVVIKERAWHWGFKSKEGGAITASVFFLMRLGGGCISWYCINASGRRTSGLAWFGVVCRLLCLERA